MKSGTVGTVATYRGYRTRAPHTSIRRNCSDCSKSLGNPGAGRDPGGFVALPWAVLDSRAYLDLSHPAKALLMEVARQFHSNDNGRMLLSGKHLATRGWKSPEVIQRAKRELLDADLIFETVKGCRPNKASWYAVTWQSLDRLPGFDDGATAAFERGAYRNAKRQNAPLTTSAVVETPSTTTGDVAMRPVIEGPPTTSPVHPLDKPSAGAGVALVSSAVRLGLGVGIDERLKTKSNPKPSSNLNGYGGTLLQQLQRRTGAKA